MRPSARFASKTVLVVATSLALAACGASGASVMGDMMAVASGGGLQIIVKRALVAALQKAGIPRAENFVSAIFTFPRDRKEAARLFLEGARDNGLDRNASNRILEVIASLATVAQLAGGGDVAGQIREFALYMRGLDLPEMLASLGRPSAEPSQRSASRAPGEAPMQQVGARGGTPGDGAEVVQADASAPAEFARAEALLSVADGKAHARKAKPLRETAWLYIESEPSNAQILVDGTPKGQGRAFVNSSGSRLREVVVSGPGYETVDGFIELEEREVTKLLVSLQPIGGRVTVLTDPWGATVAIDDLDMGRTPITLRALIPGMHRLALSSGSWSWAGNVNVSKGETSLISMSMGNAMAQAAPLPTPPPGPVVQPAPTPQLRAVAVASPPSLSGVAPTAGKPKCAPICDRFVQSVPGSGSLREPIRNRCMERCDAGDQRFSICAWKSATMDDVKTCADLPEQQ